MNEGEVVDFSSTCLEETEKLSAYTIEAIEVYKSKNPSEMSERKQNYFTPKQPFF